MTGTFYLGTHMPVWLERTTRPLFVSRRRLERRRTLPRALAPWALDSGGFSELTMFGGWRTAPADYVRQVRRYHDEIGQLRWAAPMDWMCEPSMLAKTGLTVREHQGRTVDNLLDLRDRAADLPIIPVLQGWTRDDYLYCADLYAMAGIDLAAEPVVGVGSVCRRHSTGAITDLAAELDGMGIACHAFGLKTAGWHTSRGYLASADSMAWSFDARRLPALPGHSHRSCQNCLEWAERWHARHAAVAWQPGLDTGAA